MDENNFNLPENKERTIDTRYQPYYKENNKKKKRINITIAQLMLVAFICSILGGGVVLTAFQFIAPSIQPSVDSYFSSIFTVDDVPTTKQLVEKTYDFEVVESPIVAIAEKVSPSIVGIRVTARQNDMFFGQRQGTGEGSGIIISEDGYILTNNHVIQFAMLDNNSNKVSNNAKIEVVLWDNEDQAVAATVVGRDPRTDLAVLKIERNNLSAVDIGNSDNIRPGEMAIAIGNPGGLFGSVTSGIISGIDRTIEIEEGVFTLIQTDAAINPGNSGGALVNSKGEVIGVNTVKVIGTGYEGLGFAIPINRAYNMAQTIIRGRPYIGIYPDDRFTKSMAEENKVPEGVLVYDVIPFSGAYSAGIKRQDIITKVNDIRVRTIEDMETEKNKHSIGDTIDFEIFRDGEYLTVPVTLSENKEE